MKKINVFGLIALFAVGVTTMGFRAEKVEIAEDMLLWGRIEAGGWIQTTENANCDPGPNECKVYFPKGQNPNTNPSGGISHAGGALGYVQ